MKVGTDAMLLGALAKVPDDARTAVDLGAGSGVLSLMLAQRAGHLQVSAVEIDPDAAADCALNFAASPWSANLDCICADVTEVSIRAVDVIISNPPFYTAQVASPDARREASRRADVFSPSSVVRFAARTLSPKGLATLILPYADLDRLQCEILLNRLYINKICAVSSRSGQKPFRAVVTIGRDEVDVTVGQLSIRNADNTWSDDYISLTKDFYLRIPRP